MKQDKSEMNISLEEDNENRQIQEKNNDVQEKNNTRGRIFTQVQKRHRGLE